jgi:hypothetical protein
MAPMTLAAYRKLKLWVLDRSPSLTKAIIKGKVVPIKTHHGKMESAMTMAEKKRYFSESVSPALKSTDSPSVKSLGTAYAPNPIMNSAMA